MSKILLKLQQPYIKGLMLIIILAFGLRIINITRHDSYTDEVLLSFRSIGMIDYDTSPSQTTPWQWFSDVPWWAHLSFHDHPILLFLIEHFSIGLLGVNLLAVRLPAVLLGTVSVVLLFFVARRLFDNRIALFASLLLAVNSYHVWISRLGLQDGAVIFLILLILLLWLKSNENKKYYLLCGLFIGLGIITKYSILIIFPVLLFHGILYKRKFYKEKYFWFGLVIMIIATMPVILYNFFLYKTRGHFDFQISAALNQNVPEWTFRLGRILSGTYSQRVRNFFLSLSSSQSPWFNLISSLSFIFVIYIYFKEKNRELLFLIIFTILFLLWFLEIGSAYRFVVMVTPIFVLLIACSFNYFYDKYPRKNLISVFIVFVLAEFLFSVNSFILPKSIGRENLAYAGINAETRNMGFNQLDSYLDKLLANGYSSYVGYPDYKFLEKFPKNYIEKKQNEGAIALPIMIIFDKKLNFLARLWVFDRRLYYEGWPIMDDVVFEKNTGEELDKYYRKIGIQKFIYVQAATQDVISLENIGAKTSLQKLMDKSEIEPLLIKNINGEVAFKVYEF